MPPSSSVEEPTVAPIGPADADAKPNLPVSRMLALSLANLGYGAFYSLNNAVLSLYLKQFTGNNVIIGLGGSTHSFEGAIIQPLVGAASDRMRSKWGRRRPFLLIFIPISALFLILTPMASALEPRARLAAMVACIFLFTMTFNVAQDPYNALMPDITPEPQRGRVTGVMMLFLMLGQTSLLLLPEHLTLPGIGHVNVTLESKFSICAVLMLLTTLLTCVLVREPAHSPHIAKPAHSHWQEIVQAVRGLRTLHQTGKALMTSFLSGLGIGAVFPFLTIFVKTITHCKDSEAEQMFMILAAVTSLFVLPFGRLVDKIGAKPVLLIALTLITLAAINGLWVTNLDQIRIVMILAGIGNGAQFASAYPMLVDLTPPEEIGFYTGLQSTALSIATPLTAVVTGVLINRGGYRNIFTVCCVCLVASILFLNSVDYKAAHEEIAARRRAMGVSTSEA